MNTRDNNHNISAYNKVYEWVGILLILKMASIVLLQPCRNILSAWLQPLQHNYYDKETKMMYKPVAKLNVFS